MGRKQGLIAIYEVERVGCVLGQRLHTLTDFPGGLAEKTLPDCLPEPRLLVGDRT